jgi:hypothetical protein
MHSSSQKSDNSEAGHNCNHEAMHGRATCDQTEWQRGANNTK